LLSVWQRKHELISSIEMYAADAGKDTDAITEQLDDLRLQLSTFSADFAAKYALLLPQINDAVRLLRIVFVFLCVIRMSQIVVSFLLA